MTTFDVMQTSFLGGEISPKAYGRLDLELFKYGCSEITNFLVESHGGISRRGGSMFVAEAKYHDKITRLQEYSNIDDDNFVLEWGDYYLRFYKDRVQIPVAAGYVAWGTGTVYALGDLVTQAGQWYRCIVSHTSGVFATDLTALKWEVSGGATDLAYEIPTIYSESVVKTLRFAPDDNTLIVSHITALPQKLDYTADDDWSIDSASFIAFRRSTTAESENYNNWETGHAWVTKGYYTLGQFIIYSGSWYRCLVTHVAGDFATDLAAVKWVTGAAWATTTGYVLEDLVTNGGSWYRCIIAHTSGVFATDLAAGKWIILGDTTDYVIGDLVIEDNLYYRCLIAHNAGDFDTDLAAGNWIATGGNAGTGHAIGDILTVVQAGASGGTLKVTAVDTNGGIQLLETVTQGVSYTVATTLSVTTSGTGIDAYVDCVSDSPPPSWGAADYPSLVWFYEQRLMFAATDTEPNSIWGSQSADYYNFSLGTGLDNEGLYIKVKRATRFTWVVATDVIMLGATNAEFLVVASAVDDALTPANIRPIQATNYGSALDLDAPLIDANAVFVQKGKRKIRRLQYDLASSKYIARDISILGQHITESGIVDVAHSTDPDSIMWFVRDDGAIAALTYDPDNNIYAWHKHFISGTDAGVTSICSTDGEEDYKDELWMVVERTIDGSTVQYIEYLTQGLTSDENIEDSFFVDSGVTATGSDLATVTTLDHLEGEEVQILADGAVQAPQTVSSGTVTIDPVADKVNVGLGFTSYVDTLPLEGGNPVGSSQGKIKTIHAITLRLNRSLGLQYGVPDGIMDTYFFSPGLMDVGAALFTGDTDERPFPGGPDALSLVRIQQTDPLPLNILGIMLEANTEV